MIKIPFTARVAALFVLSLAACVPVQQYDQLEQDYVQLQAQLSAEIAADQVEITKLEGQLKVTMKADLRGVAA